MTTDRTNSRPHPSVASTEQAGGPPAPDFEPVYPLEVPTARPTLAPITLAFGLFLLGLGALVSQWWVLGLGAALALLAALAWLRESLRGSA